MGPGGKVLPGLGLVRPLQAFMTIGRTKINLCCALLIWGMSKSQRYPGLEDSNLQILPDPCCLGPVPVFCGLVDS